MELLLNILWLMLSLAAVFVWRHKSGQTEVRSIACRSRCALLLGCLLALLFPVVSATDDLHAVWQEAEESSSSKRIAKQAHTNRTSASGHDEISPVALLHNDRFVIQQSIGVASPAPTVQMYFNSEVALFSSRAPPVSSHA